LAMADLSSEQSTYCCERDDSTPAAQGTALATVMVEKDYFHERAGLPAAVEGLEASTGAAP
jgi:hypothetical protein